MKIRHLLLVGLLLLPAPAMAAGGSCYTPSEAEAEQGIRIHSELMVIGLNCQHLAKAAGNKNLYATYHEFTKNHLRVFADYEARLMDYYQRSGKPNPEGELHTLRTRFANQIALDAAKMRPDIFCARFAPRIDQVAALNNDDVRRWAATFSPKHPVSQPICAK